MCTTDITTNPKLYPINESALLGRGRRMGSGMEWSSISVIYIAGLKKVALLTFCHVHFYAAS